MYDAWGKIVSITDGNGNDVSNDPTHIANINPIRYRSYYYDRETNLYYLESRYYDPETGRFLNADNLGYMEPETVTGLNLYAYCGNNPVMNTDPTGRAWWNPFSWDWKGTAKKVCAKVSNFVEEAVDFVKENSDIIAGAVAVTAAVAVGVVTMGAGTAAVATVAGALFGGTFGALNSAATGGNVAQGFATGMFVGALGASSGWAAGLGAFGMTLLNNRVNNQKVTRSTWKSAVVSGVTAGTFSAAGNFFGKTMIDNVSTAVAKGAAEVLSAGIFSTYNFMVDIVMGAESDR